MVVKKFNYFRFIAFIITIIVIVLTVFFIIKHIKYKNSYEYKLLNVGYKDNDVSTIINKLENSEIEKLLSYKYDDKNINYIKEKYFLFDNFDKYVNYKKINKSIDYNKVIAIINTNTDIDWLNNELKTDVSKNELMLVNRLYGLDEDYKVEDIVDIPVKYAYNNKKISSSILDSIIALCEDAKNDGYTFIVSEGYRSYKEQEKIYKNYISYYGREKADKNVARPGHSEYETGLSIELVPYNNVKDPKNSDEYDWLKNNAYKYGFINRFEEDKEYLTGFSENIWRLRYVGNSAAETMYYENICFEEYYAYYVIGGKS